LIYFFTKPYRPIAICFSCKKNLITKELISEIPNIFLKFAKTPNSQNLQNFYSNTYPKPIKTLKISKKAFLDPLGGALMPAFLVKMTNS